MDKISAEVIFSMSEARAAGLDLSEPYTGAEFVLHALQELRRERYKRYNRRPVSECLAAAVEKCVSTPQGDKPATR